MSESMKNLQVRQVVGSGRPLRIAVPLIYTFVCCLGLGGFAQAADLDTVWRPGDARGFAGQITAVTKNDITVTQKVGNKVETIPANEVVRIEFLGEPPILNLARSNEAAGRFNDAMAGYQEALGAGGSENIKTEINFLMARTLAKMAQADPSKAADAIAKLNAFANAGRDNFRYYPTQLLLGEIALMVNDHVTAESAFDRLQQSPWDDYKMIGKIGTARALLAQKKVDEAKPLFDAVANMKVNKPSEQTAILQAMLGQAESLQLKNETDKAVEILNKVVNQAVASDSRILAQAYLQLGAAYALDSQKSKEALLAYLHVDVIPSLAAESDLHAEALYNLSKLWPAVGQPARGAEASGKLQQDYPTSEWTKKLDSVE